VNNPASRPINGFVRPLKIRTLALACTTLDPGRFPRSVRREIAVSGRSNVGKSSLLNTIIGRKNIARVSKEPGKTQTVNFYLINDRFYLVDLPGYGFARVSVEMRRRWRRVIFDYLGGRDSIGGIVQLIDARHPPMKDDLMVIEKLIESERPFLVVMTKADKIGRDQRKKMIAGFQGHLGGHEVEMLRNDEREAAGEAGKENAAIPIVFFSAKTGEGKDAIWRWIAGHIG
jgi:GTP-binding protein